MTFSERLSELPLAAQLRVAIKTSDVGLLHRLMSSHPEFLDLPDEQGCTPLHLAVDWQHLSMVSALVRSGADRTAMDCRGHTPLDIAQMSGEYRMGAYTEVSRQIVACLEIPPHHPDRALWRTEAEGSLRFHGTGASSVRRASGGAKRVSLRRKKACVPTIQPTGEAR